MSTGSSLYYDGYDSYDCPKTFLAIKPLKGVVRLIRAKKSIFSIIFFKDTINIYLFV